MSITYQVNRPQTWRLINVVQLFPGSSSFAYYLHCENWLIYNCPDSLHKQLSYRVCSLNFILLKRLLFSKLFPLSYKVQRQKIETQQSFISSPSAKLISRWKFSACKLIFQRLLLFSLFWFSIYIHKFILIVYKLLFSNR